MECFRTRVRLPPPPPIISITYIVFRGTFPETFAEDLFEESTAFLFCLSPGYRGRLITDLVYAQPNEILTKKPQNLILVLFEILDVFRVRFEDHLLGPVPIEIDKPVHVHTNGQRPVVGINAHSHTLNLCSFANCRSGWIWITREANNIRISESLISWLNQLTKDTIRSLRH